MNTHSGSLEVTGETCDFLVIGGGIAGAAAAYFLSPHGRVILLEQEAQPGFHSTGRSAAVLTENYGDETIRKLTIASRSFLETPPDGFAEHPILTPRGVLWLAEAAQRERLDALASEASRLVPSVSKLSGGDIRDLCPVIRSDYAVAGLFEPNAMDIDVSALHQGFLRGLRMGGGRTILSSTVTAIARRAGLWNVTAGKTAYAAPVVINAAGAWCDEIATLAGVRTLGLVPRRRTAFTFDSGPDDRVTGWPLVVDVEERFYFKPEGGALMGSPADETPAAPGDAQPEEIDVAVGVHHIQQATILDIRHLRSKWAGLRSSFSDGLPVIDEFPRGSGLYWSAGHGGYGIMSSPAVGQALAACVTEGDLPEALRGVGLARSVFAADRPGLATQRKG